MPSPRSAHGQLLLFPLTGREPERASPTDLDSLFDELNDRFFDGRLRAEVEWSNRLTACAGTCRPARRLIRISRIYHERKPEALRATLAHEMCHLLVPNHGAAFRRLAEPVARALELSYRQFRYSERWADLKRYRYVYACPTCSAEMPSKKRRRVSCGRCSEDGYDERHKMTLIESRARPGPVLRGERPARA